MNQLCDVVTFFGWSVSAKQVTIEPIHGALQDQIQDIVWVANKCPYNLSQKPFCVCLVFWQPKLCLSESHCRRCCRCRCHCYIIIASAVNSTKTQHNPSRSPLIT